MDVLRRLQADQRKNFDDVRNAYITSTITGQRVPLRSVAELEPAWQITRIVRRNGFRTLTVGGFATICLGEARHALVWRADIIQI